MTQQYFITPVKPGDIGDDWARWYVSEASGPRHVFALCHTEQDAKRLVAALEHYDAHAAPDGYAPEPWGDKP